LAREFEAADVPNEVAGFLGRVEDALEEAGVPQVVS